MSNSGVIINPALACNFELNLPARPRTSVDRAAGHTAYALGLGPAPAPGAGRAARRIGIGLMGTLASVLWMWNLAPLPA